MEKLRARGCDSAKVIEVIETIAIKGTGTENDPIREIIQYWSTKGEWLAENDPYELHKETEGGD